MTIPAARQVARTGDLSGFVASVHQQESAREQLRPDRDTPTAVRQTKRRSLRRILTGRGSVQRTWEERSAIDPVLLEELEKNRNAEPTPRTKRLITFGAVAMIISALSTVFAKPLGDALRSGTTLFAQSTLSVTTIGAIAALVVISVASGAWIIAARSAANTTSISAPVRLIAACAVVVGALTLVALIALLLTSARV
ncbi:hypothetical protein [Rhodococcus qingshengii]|uniref:hypothetical protein n=1 Tax=Rhodococcus qingshengii TaxID=334542 RepID=UPI0021B1300D|nr:hypothetical protein [Rhodococcus qingshengii]MCT6735543.1 hypothetical protein [Rhodococcus qingshengii]